MHRRLTLTIHGEVQGVNFRSQLKDLAQQLGIFGRVKNQPDGTVEARLEGNENDLQKLLSLCYNGIHYAKVVMVDAVWRNATGEFTDFMIE